MTEGGGKISPTRADIFAEIRRLDMIVREELEEEMLRPFLTEGEAAPARRSGMSATEALAELRRRRELAVARLRSGDFNWTGEDGKRYRIRRGRTYVRTGGRYRRV